MIYRLVTYAHGPMRKAIGRLVTYAHGPMRRAVGNRRLLAAINAIYNASPSRAKIRFKNYFDRIFWEHASLEVSGTWTVHFMDRPFAIPLRPQTINLDWIYALSLITHDAEIVKTYEGFLSLPEPPEVFLDIGSNYGMHSLLMAKMGLKVFAFEPNPDCRTYAKKVFDLNSVNPDVLPYALGASEGSMELTYSRSQTWLGSLLPEATTSLAERGLDDVQKVLVQVRELDNIPLHDGRLLIKMDVEGAELLVLEGAVNILNNRKPNVIFESNSTYTHGQLWKFFSELGWKVYKLPFHPESPGKEICNSNDMNGKGTNFIAVPPKER